MNFSDMISELKTYKNNLVSILVGKGVEAEETEGFNTLIPKVEQIESGNSDEFDAFLNNTLTELNNPRITSLAYVPATSITVLNLPSVTSIPNNFKNKKMETVIMPSLLNTGISGFSDEVKLTHAQFDSLTTIGMNGLMSCTTITKFDFPSLTSIGTNGLKGCTNLETLIFRSETMVTAGGSTPLGNCKIASGEGYIYVPNALIDTYKANTNWSTYADQFRAIEDYPDICG